jgi:hypothetical protein
MLMRYELLVQPLRFTLKVNTPLRTMPVGLRTAQKMPPILFDVQKNG